MNCNVNGVGDPNRASHAFVSGQKEKQRAAHPRRPDIGLSHCLLVIAMAEAAALMLAHFPASEFLWYLNQDVFRFMENARDSLNSPISWLICQTTLDWDLTLAFLVLLAYRLRWRFAVALIGHGCLMFAGFLTYDWAVAMKLPESASLEPIIALCEQPNGAVLVLACGAALLATILAHLTYLAGRSSIWRGQIHAPNSNPHRAGSDPGLCRRR
jgi:hypothetical protein